MKYQFHPEALFEFEAAADFYAERQKGLEFRFIDAVHSAIHRAALGEALAVMEKSGRKVYVLPVVNAERKLIGALRMHDIVGN